MSIFSSWPLVPPLLVSGLTPIPTSYFIIHFRDEPQYDSNGQFIHGWTVIPETNTIFPIGDTYFVNDKHMNPLVNHILRSLAYGGINPQLNAELDMVFFLLNMTHRMSANPVETYTYLKGRWVNPSDQNVTLPILISSHYSIYLPYRELK
jgi:hypothetical protein